MNNVYYPAFHCPKKYITRKPSSKRIARHLLSLRVFALII